MKGKVRDGGETDLLSAGLLPRWPQWPGLGKAKPAARSFQVSHMGGAGLEKGQWGHELDPFRMLTLWVTCLCTMSSADPCVVSFTLHHMRN